MGKSKLRDSSYNMISWYDRIMSVQGVLKMKLFICFFLFSTFALAENRYGYLSAEDQKYYKNDSMDGNNQRERIDSSVKEINRLHGEINGLKAEIQAIRKEIDELKKSK